MPHAAPKVTVPELLRLKTAATKITALTAYDYPFARIVDESGSRRHPGRGLAGDRPCRGPIPPCR